MLQSLANMRLSNIVLGFKSQRKIILKSILYFILLIIFITFYLIDEIQTYAKRSKTLTSQTIEVEILEAPQVMLCFEPHFKPSMLQKYNLPKSLNFDDIEDRSGNLNKWELYQNLSYDYDKDFTLSLESVLRKSSREIDFEVQKIATYRHGLCYLIKYNHNVSIEDEKISLNFSFIGLTSDVPKSINVFLTTPNDWHGIIIDDWPLLEPVSFNLPIENEYTSRWIAKVSQTDNHYMKGNEDFEQCLLKKIDEKSRCESKCFPILYNFLQNYPPCTTIEEFNCMFSLLFEWRKHRYDCLQAKKNIQYKANFFAGPRQKNIETNVTFQFYFDKGTKEIREEVLIVTEGNLLGSVGGSLGLFLGFSCFTYISGIIDKVLP